MNNLMLKYKTFYVNSSEKFFPLLKGGSYAEWAIFVRSYVRSFVCLFVCSFVCSYVRSVIIALGWFISTRKIKLDQRFFGSRNSNLVLVFKNIFTQFFLQKNTFLRKKCFFIKFDQRFLGSRNSNLILVFKIFHSNFFAKKHFFYEKSVFL